jgi:hypothetical protein
MNSRGIVGFLAGLLLMTGFAVYQHRRAKLAGDAIGRLHEERAALTAKLEAAGKRVVEVERDNEQMLKLLEAARASAPRVAATPPAAPATGDRAERIAIERSFQRDLAARRAAANGERAETEKRLAGLPPTERFAELMRIARELEEKHAYTEAIRYYNEGMATKPRDLEISPETKELMDRLRAQQSPVEVSFEVPAETVAMIPGFRMVPAGTSTLHILPGDYEVIGIRPGFEDVRIPLTIRGGEKYATVTVACTVPAAAK